MNFLPHLRLIVVKTIQNLNLTPLNKLIANAWLKPQERRLLGLVFIHVIRKMTESSFLSKQGYRRFKNGMRKIGYLHFTRDITSKRATSGAAYFGSLAAGKQNCED